MVYYLSVIIRKRSNIMTIYKINKFDNNNNNNNYTRLGVF